MRVILQPFSSMRLGDLLRSALNGEVGEFHTFQAAVAFVKKSGVQHIYEFLQDFTRRGNSVRLVVGIDQQVSSQEGLKLLLEAAGDSGEVWINHTKGTIPVTFHPKIYLFEGGSSSLLIIGSGNLTSGGLFTNDEASSVQMLNPQASDDVELLTEIKKALNYWCDESLGNALRLNEELLRILVEEGYVRSEATSRAEAQAEAEEASARRHITESEGPHPRRVSFGQGVERRRPPRSPLAHSTVETDEAGAQATPGLPPFIRALSAANWFAITVLEGDLPQKGSSPEIRIGKAIRDVVPEFWGWRDSYEYDEERGQYTRNVRIRFNDQIVNAYLKDFPARKPDRTKASADFQTRLSDPDRPHFERRRRYDYPRNLE